MALNRKVQQLPPIDGVKDPQTRTFLEGLRAAWETRNGTVGANEDERFVTKAEIGDITSKSLADLLTGGSGSTASGGSSGSGTPARPAVKPNPVTQWLWDYLRQQVPLIAPPWSVVDEVLGRMTNSDAAIASLNQISVTSQYTLARQVAVIEAVFGLNANRVFIQGTPPGGTLIINDEWIDTSTGNSVHRWDGTAWVTDQVAAQGVAAVIVTEQSARASADLAVASVVNTLWAQFNTGVALVQSGSTVVAGTGYSQAGTYQQVQAILTDPGTGGLYSSSVLQTMKSDVNTNTGVLTALWSVKMDQDINGVHYVAGVGLAMQNGVSAFAVAADQFSIISPGHSALAPFLYDTTLGVLRVNSTRIVDYIMSDNYVSGVSGWGLNNNGNAEFSSCTVRGNLYATVGNINRLIITGAIEGNVSVPNNGQTTVTHNEGRKVVVTCWTGNSAFAVIASMDDNSFTVGAGNSGGTTVFYRYF